MIDTIDKTKAEKEFYKKFEVLVGKILNIKTETRTYNGLKLIGVDQEGSPVRFLNFENKEGFTPKTICLLAKEIKTYEVEDG